MKYPLIFGLLIGLIFGKAEVKAALPDYDVRWDALGKTSADSMPLGNGDIGLNVWTEPNGDVLFYVSKTDAWTEDVRHAGLAKIGRVRVSLDSNPFVAGAGFEQRLRLQDGEITVASGAGAERTVIRIWVDANQPVVHVEAEAGKPVTMTVTRDPWREPPQKAMSPDVLLPAKDNRIAWYHRNDPAKTKIPELLNLTFGAAIEGEGLVAAEGASLRSSEPASRQSFAVYPLTAKTADPAEWQRQLEADMASLRGSDLEKARAAHRQWWREFWDRSHVFLSGGADAERVTRGYMLQRFVTACAGRGAYAVKFNGSLFTVDDPQHTDGKDKTTGQPVPAPFTADDRDWGAQYWFQNTRPMYWPRLMAGDFDLMQPFFRMYRAMLEKNAAQVKEFYGHGGSYFAETSSYYGGLSKLTPESNGYYTGHYYSGVLELSAMMLDYYAYTEDEAFARDFLLPVADFGLTFYDEHFPHEADGTLRIEPANSIEMFWKVRNPTPDVAGLHYVLPRLLALPGGLVDADRRERWTRLLKQLPPVAIGEKEEKRLILPYGDTQTAPPHNSENPELYTIYPYRLFGLGKPDYELARATFDARRFKGAGCWSQDPVQAAYLGLADLAKQYATFNLTRQDPRLKFPAFWAHGHDYEPDEDNGGNGEHALQLMLMQSEGDRIVLLPAWPAAWNADFKLLAPHRTTVEGRVENGKLVELKVTPESRRKDVEIHEAQSKPPGDTPRGS